MNGDKVLIKGNHDKLELKEYLPYFRDIRACHQFDGMFLSHVPIHTESLSRWKINVHGHLHANRVMTAFGAKVAERYQSVCMEQLDDYTPISLEQLKSRIEKLGLNKE
jgi:calcineurin-like phosphoesterase family protein